MNIYFLVFALALFFFLIRFLYRIEKNNTINPVVPFQKHELQSSPITPEESFETVEQSINKQNSFLNPNDDFGTLKKGVVLDNQTYEYEVGDNDSSNFIIIELSDESKEIRD
jgi:hypothetical protein